jgi:signal transduction histidine kinase/CHASE3 domain sensor protein
MRTRLTIFKMGLILVAVPAFFQLALIALIADLRQQVSDAQERSTHSKQVLIQTQDVLGSLLEAQNAVRGFVFSGDPVFAEPHNRATREVPKFIAELKKLVRDNPSQVDHLRRIEDEAIRLMSFFAEEARLVRIGEREQAEKNIIRSIGRLQMDKVRAAVHAFLQEETRLDMARSIALGRSEQRLGWVLMGGAVASILSSLGLAFVFRRSISRRFAALAGNVQRLAKGHELAAAIPGKDEIAQLDRAFHELASSLRAADRALGSQTRILQSVLDSMGDGVVVADANGKFVLFNPSATRILGMGPCDVPPEQWTDQYGIFLPDMVTPFPARDLPLARAVRGEAVDAEEMFVRHPRMPEGAWISVTGRPLTDAASEMGGGVVVVRDITDARKAANALRRMNEELEDRVADRTAELAAANRELVQRNKENEMFVYSVSHDLRSPLVNLQGFSKEIGLACVDLRGLLAESDLPAEVKRRGLGILDGDMGESIRFLQTAVTRLSGIIDALLRLSRAGRVEYQLQEVGLQPIVKRVVEAMSATSSDHGAVVTTGDLPVVVADSAAIEQVLANLIGNALNYLDPGRPGVVEIGSLPPLDEATGWEGGPRTIYVRDNGLGIPEAYKPKVFQAFQRIHPGVAKGEGIGLAIVHRVVERHGGRIWFESVEGEGTTFFVSLRAASPRGSSGPGRLADAVEAGCPI